MNMIYIYILNESSLHNYKLLHLYIVSYIELMRSYKRMTMSHQKTLITLVRLVVTILGRDARKPAFGVSDKVRFKPACSPTETS